MAVKKTRKLRAKDEDLAYGIASTNFFKSYSTKLNKAHNRQIKEYQSTKDFKVFSESFWTKDEKRILEMWKQIEAIINHLNEIYSTVKYIKLKGLKTFLSKNGITENEYLRFMYENHLIRISSTPDICAILGDMILKTGISERQLNWYRFSNHPKVKGHKCAITLLELSNKLETLRRERHKIIHFGGHKSEIIESIESNTFDKRFLKISPFLKKHFKTSRTNELRKLTREMKANFKICVKYTKAFLNSLTRDIDPINV